MRFCQRSRSSSNAFQLHCAPSPRLSTWLRRARKPLLQACSSARCPRCSTAPAFAFDALGGWRPWHRRRCLPVGVISPAEGLVEVNMRIGKPWQDQRLGRRCVLTEGFWRMQVAVVAPSESHEPIVSIDLRQRTPDWNLHQAAWNPGLQDDRETFTRFHQ